MIRGTNHEQDARFADKTKKMLQNSNWPDKYDIKIDLTKVDVELINAWIEQRVYKLIGQEDDIITGTIIGIIQQHHQKEQKLNAKPFHVAITGLLQEKTLTFVSQLWDILDEAQRSSRGIPECLLEDKKRNQEVHRKKLEELNNKRNKLNNQRFNHVIKRFTNNYQQDNYEAKKKDKRQEFEPSSNRSRSHSRQHKKSKNKNVQKKKRRQRDRSQSRSRSERRHKSKKRSQRDRKKDRKDRDRGDRNGDKKERKDGGSRGSSSESSGVISSSSESEK